MSEGLIVKFITSRWGLFITFISVIVGITAIIAFGESRINHGVSVHDKDINAHIELQTERINQFNILSDKLDDLKQTNDSLKNDLRETKYDIKEIKKDLKRLGAD